MGELPLSIPEEDMGPLELILPYSGRNGYSIENYTTYLHFLIKSPFPHLLYASKYGIYLK